LGLLKRIFRGVGGEKREIRSHQSRGHGEGREGVSKKIRVFHFGSVLKAMWGPHMRPTEKETIQSSSFVLRNRKDLEKVGQYGKTQDMRKNGKRTKQ